MVYCTLQSKYDICKWISQSELLTGTSAEKWLTPNPQHFGSNPADIQIRIGINPEILM